MKRKKLRKKPTSISQWMAWLCQAIVNNDFRAKALFLNTIHDEFWVDINNRFWLNFTILDEQLTARAKDPNEILFSRNFSLLIDILKIRVPVERLRNLLTEVHLKIPHSTLLKELKPPGWEKYFNRYKKKKKVEDFQEALRSGLLQHIYDETDKLLRFKACDPALKSEMTKYVLTLIRDTLSPIINFQGGISREIITLTDTCVDDMHEKARINLKKVAEALSSPSHVGRTAKISQNNKLKFWQTASIAFLYGLFWLWFKDVKKYGDTDIKKKLTQDYNLKKMEPSNSGKRILCKHFEISLGTLNNLLSKKHTVYIQGKPEKFG